MDFTLPTRLSDVTRNELIEIRSLEFMKWLCCYAEAQGSRTLASEWYVEQYPNSFGATYVKKELEVLRQPGVDLKERALMPPATTLGSTYAAPLVGVDMLASGFLAQVHAKSVLGQIPNMLRVPFQVRVPTEDAGANYQWVGEGGAKPVSTMTFNQGVTLTRLKGAAIPVFTGEFIRSITDATAATLRNTLRNGLVKWSDKAFLDPTSTAVATVRPASITAGVTPVTPGANFAASMQALLNTFFTNRPDAEEPVLIAAAQKEAEIMALGPNGVGLPIVRSPAAGTSVVMVDGAGMFYADDGVTIDTSDTAAIQMNSTPDSPPTAATVFVSLWQQNLRGFLVERFLSWHATPGSVQYLA